VGATLQVEDGSKYFELVGAKGSQISLLADGKVHKLRYDAVQNVRVQRELKLSDIIAQIDNLEVTTTRVATNADRFAAMHQQMLLDDISNHQTYLRDDAEMRAETAQSQAAAAKGTPGMAAAEESFANAKAARDVAITNDIAAQKMTTGIAIRNESSADNALKIVCTLSTPRTTHNAYALMITEFRSGTTASTSSYKVHIESIGDLGPKPKRVTMTQDGLPEGFSVVRTGIHLYSDSKELATNLSEKRVDLTSDDALRYLVLCYVTAHARPTDTLAATPLYIAIPPELKQKVAAAELGRTLFLTVGSDGTVKSLSAAGDQPGAIDPYVDSTVRRFRYHPAIKNGKAIESVVELKLASLL
jgi:hypothetical protein